MLRLPEVEYTALVLALVVAVIVAVVVLASVLLVRAYARSRRGQPDIIPWAAAVGSGNLGQSRDMSRPTQPPATPAPHSYTPKGFSSRPVSILIVVLVTLGFGALAPVVQEYFPAVIRPFATSAGGWTAIVVIAILLAKSRPILSVILGIVGYLLLNNGYALVSSLQGTFYFGEFWNIVAFVAGPIVGLATAWIRAGALRLAAIGSGVIGAIFLGEGVYGLFFAARTIGTTYWVVEVIVGIVVIAAVGLTRLRDPLLVASSITTAVVGAAVSVIAYSAIANF